MKAIKRLITNVKVAKKILEGTFIMCPYCMSIEVVHEEPYLEYGDAVRVKEYHIKCKKCNARGSIKEGWSKY